MENIYKSESDAINAINAKVKELVCKYLDENGNCMGKVEIKLEEGMTSLQTEPEGGEMNTHRWFWRELSDGTWTLIENTSKFSI